MTEMSLRDAQPKSPRRALRAGLLAGACALAVVGAG